MSSIICRGDNLNEKAEKVNSTLLSLCQGLHLGYLDNSNINQEHLTYKGRFPGLHLNADGTNILFSNLVNSINSWYVNACVDNPPPIFDSEKEGDDIDLDFDNSEDAFTALQSWRVKNSNRIALGSLNINSLPNKIDGLRTLITNNIDVLVVQETKIDSTFTNESIAIPGYVHKPFRRDRKLGGGGIVTYIREFPANF